MVRENGAAVEVWLRRYAALFVVFTLTLGVLMRWGLAVGFPRGLALDFLHLRHAHSHAGYFGILVAAWWLVAKVQGVRLDVRVVHAYAATALLASALFAVMGYRWPTMALSTVLALFWLYGGVLQHRARGGAWLDGAAVGLAAGVVLVPMIAVMARRDFALSRDLAHLFVAWLLFTVFAPAAWQASGCQRRRSILVHLVLAAGAAVGLIFPVATAPVGPMVLAAFSAWLLLVVVEAGWSLWWRVLWSVLPAGLLVAVFVPQLQHHNWRMAGLHAITLGPILVTLGWFVFRLRPPWVLLAGYLVAVVGMNTALVLDVAPAPVWVALFSTATALGVGAVLVHHQARQHFAIPEE